MTARKKYIIIVLFVATIDWALWLGGQFFNALMVIPGWSANPPETITWYSENMLSHISAYFFLVINPVFLLLFLIIAWILSLKIKTSFTKWFGIAILLDLIITLTVGIWMAPTAQGIFNGAIHHTIDTETINATLQTWKLANGIRIGFGVITLFFFLMSIFNFNKLQLKEIVNKE